MISRTTIKELNDYLRTEDFFPKGIEERGNGELNKSIKSKWKNKIEEALKTDFRQIPGAEQIQVNQTDSLFEITDRESHGATIWKSFLNLTDKNETMNVVVSFVVNHDNSFIYLGESHTNLDKYPGTSEPLKRLFKTLKQNEKVGHFFQTKFYNLDLRSATATNKMYKTWLGRILKL